MMIPTLLALAVAAAQQREPVVVEPVPENVAVVDLDGDGPREMIGVRGANVRLLGLTGVTPRAEIPGEATLWTVADHDGDGADDFLALVDGEALHRLEYREGRLVWSEPLLEGLGGRNGLPRGHRASDFVRDLDEDGRPDLLVPLADRVRMFFGTGDGFEQGPDLNVAARLELQVGDPGALRPGNLLGSVRRKLTVPRIGMRDLSGDGKPDLQVTEGLRIHQYIQGGDGLPPEPTQTVDLKRFESKLGEMRLDPSNIAALTRYAVWETWSDLNLDGAQDLIVLVGGTVVIYLGGEQGVDLRRPRDQLPTRGNVLYALAAPVDGDELPDLILVRIEDVSLARALSWLLFSVSLEVDILAYKGLGNGRFEHRPLEQSKTFELELPSALDLSRSDKVREALRRTIVRIADFDGDGRATDLVVLDDDGRLRGFRDLVKDPRVLETVTERFLSSLLRRSAETPLDVETLTGWVFGRTSLLVSLSRGKRPLFDLAPPPGWESPQAMTVVDIDGDGGDEVLVLRRFVKEGEVDADSSKRRLTGYVFDPAEFDARQE